MDTRAGSVAFLAAALHLLAALSLLLLLQPALPGAAYPARIAYLETHRAAWTLGWLTWQLAAMSLLALMAVLALRFRGTVAVTAMCIAAAAFSIDFASESRYMGVLPELRGDAFAALDRELDVLIGFAANGLYTIALALLVGAGWRALPSAARILAVPVVASGLALAAASLAHDARAETISSAVLFPLLVLWMIVVGLWLRRNA
ncbi:MAG: hypothetical protein JO197_09415 [Acidobacteria bacterium]|nr:hypothetical protein [Acidobacteriota bacterium]MBV9477314.1 hypothetical protein [Acidobacteriota bacterium]